MKKIIKWFKDMIDAELSVSSKRFCGVLGWLVVLFIAVWCTLHVVQAPVIVETIIYVIAGLLGIDKLSEILRGKLGRK